MYARLGRDHLEPAWAPGVIRRVQRGRGSVDPARASARACAVSSPSPARRRWPDRLLGGPRMGACSATFGDLMLP
jgi:hypothetical protein